MTRHERFWENGILARELVDGEVRTENIGKTPEEMGVQVIFSEPKFRLDLVGPGTELQKLIARFGLKPKTGCKCNARILEMNRNGEAWCIQNISVITGWLREEASRAGYPFSEVVAKLLIRRAVRNSLRRA